MRATVAKISTLCVCFFGGCAPSSTPQVEPDPDPVETGQEASALVGVEGGSVSLGDAMIEIPADALSDEKEIRVRVTATQAPEVFTAYSPVYRFEPAGQAFDQPVTLRLPFAGSSERATIFWTAEGGDQYVSLPTRVEDGLAVAEISHFSRGFVGSACGDDDCCDRANGLLDVLLVVDNSGSMSEEQLALADQLPRMARVLATGDLDDDGEQDFPALQSVRVGVVTSDMGTLGYTIQTCSNPLAGDNGELQTEGNSSIAGCEMSYPSFAEMSADDADSDIDAFIKQVECVGVAGIGGCGFEQQLEASYAALTVQTEPGGANEGFLRDDSILAVIMLTDEDDCSTGNEEIFNPSRDDLGPLNTRCALHDGELYDVARYVGGLQSTRTDPLDVIFGLIAGIPEDLIDDLRGTDFDAMLDDPRMIPTFDPSNPNEMLPSCETSNGRAYPPRRMVELAREFGGNAVVQSICQYDFRQVIGAILDRVASRARGECL